MSRNQKVNTKFTTISKLSGEVTAALTPLDSPSAKDAYNRIQDIEASTVAAATAEQAAVTASNNADSVLDAARTQLRLLNTACINICAVQKIVSAQHFTIMDKGDDAGLARRLEPEIRRVPRYGAGLADALHHLLQDLEVAEAEAQRAETQLTTAMRELDSAILNLQAVVAQGRAVLATFGVKLTRKTKKKAANTNTEPAAPTTVQPATQPVVMPVAA